MILSVITIFKGVFLLANTRKIIKRILLAILILLLLGAIAVYCVFRFYIKPTYGQKIIKAVETILDDEELMTDIEQSLADEDIQAEISSALIEEGLQTAIDNPDAEQGQSDAAAAKPTNQPKTEVSAPSQNTQNKVNEVKPAPTKAPSNKKQTLMEKAKANVEPKDFADGMRIASKVDTGYLLGLMSGGLTAEEKAEAKKYLKSRLSGAEISRVKKYIAKYSHLLTD